MTASLRAGPGQSVRFEAVDGCDPRLARSATGLLAAANSAGVLTAATVHVATRLGELGGETDERVLLAAALAVRAVTHGSVGVDLGTVAASVDPEGELGWPGAEAWTSVVLSSPLVAKGVLRHEHDLLYLDRYHRLEVKVRDDLVARRAAAPPAVDEARLDAVLTRIFPGEPGAGSAPDYSEQRAAARAAAIGWTSVLTGGPGTGKTTTVAGLLAVLHDQARQRGERLSVAVAAPTGKAAARLQEAVLDELAGDESSGAGRFSDDDRAALAGLHALTLHRLLGWVPDNSTRFRHHRGNRLKYDLVVVDESSMVDLLMMARLLEAVRPDARLVLVGDPDQLTSVGAGAVLADLVRGLADSSPSPVVSLTTTHRYDGEIADLAAALRDGHPDEVMACLRRGGDRLEYVDLEVADGGSRAELTADTLRPDLLATASAVREAAVRGDVDAALRAVDEHRLICAHRDGPHGVAHWNRQVERWLAHDEGVDHWPLWYPGRPLLVTANDYGLGVYNGETGCVVRRDDGALRAVINGSSVGGSGGPLDFAISRLSDVETMHALTVHKSQGSQVERVTVLLPPEDSRLLTRELFYTAVTRARRHVRVVGTEAEVRAAVTRRADRATGLRQRLATP